MTPDDRHDPPTPPWLARARPVARPLPDPAYRARVKRAFLEAAARDASRPAWWRFAAPLAWAGAAAAAAVITAALNAGPSWQPVALTAADSIRVDGRPVATAGLGRALHASAVVEVPAGAELDLRLGEVLYVQVTGGTRVRLPNAPGRWFARAMASEVLAGETRYATGPAFPGASLVIGMGAAHARVVGTAFAAIRDSVGSCVCVVEGDVRVAPGVGAPYVLHEGWHRVTRADGAPSPAEPLPPMEVMKLGMFRDRAREAWER